MLSCSFARPSMDAGPFLKFQFLHSASLSLICFGLGGEGTGASSRGVRGVCGPKEGGRAKPGTVGAAKTGRAGDVPGDAAGPLLPPGPGLGPGQAKMGSCPPDRFWGNAKTGRFWGTGGIWPGLGLPFAMFDMFALGYPNTGIAGGGRIGPGTPGPGPEAGIWTGEGAAGIDCEDVFLGLLDWGWGDCGRDCVGAGGATGTLMTICCGGSLSVHHSCKIRQNTGRSSTITSCVRHDWPKDQRHLPRVQ